VFHVVLRNTVADVLRRAPTFDPLPIDAAVGRTRDCADFRLIAGLVDVGRAYTRRQIG
jgi:hypothetical protein